MTNRFISFFEKIGGAFKKIFGSSATWELTALGTIKYVGPLVTLILGILNPEAGTVASNILKELQASLSTLYAIAQDGKVTAGSSAAATVKAEIDSINQNMAALLADAQVKNSAKVSEIEATSTAITQEMDALLSNLPA